jgi:hypothetical protein
MPKEPASWKHALHPRFFPSAYSVYSAVYCLVRFGCWLLDVPLSGFPFRTACAINEGMKFRLKLLLGLAALLVPLLASAAQVYAKGKSGRLCDPIAV